MSGKQNANTALRTETFLVKTMSMVGQVEIQNKFVNLEKNPFVLTLDQLDLREVNVSFY